MINIFSLFLIIKVYNNFNFLAYCYRLPLEPLDLPPLEFELGVKLSLLGEGDSDLDGV